MKRVIVIAISFAFAVTLVRVSPRRDRTYLVQVEDFRVRNFASTNHIELERLDNEMAVGPEAISFQSLTNGQVVRVQALMGKHWLGDKFLSFVASPKP